MKDIINFNNSLDNIKDVKIFFGKSDGIQRYDRFKYPITDRLTKVQQSAFWMPKEINYAKDMVGIHNVLSPTHKEIYNSNLLFQTLADSLANRFLDNVLSEYITSPEWERVIKWQSLFELIHSEAYSENIRKVYSDAEQFFNEGFKNKNIQNRLDLELKSYNELEQIMKDDSVELDKKKKAIVEVCLRQYALENIRFFISFLYTYHLNEINEQVLQGSVNNITLILNDEIIHTTIFRHLINSLMNNPDEGFSHLVEYKNTLAQEIFKEVIESEVNWFKYLSSIEEFEGFGETQIREFLNYYASRALELIKVDNKDFIGVRNNLVEFFESKKNLNNTKALAQETEILTYNIGVLEDKNYDKADLLEFVKGEYGTEIN